MRKTAKQRLAEMFGKETAERILDLIRKSLPSHSMEVN